jgi:hypothetical protein
MGAIAGIEHAGEVVFDHARKMAARGMKIGSDFLDKSNETFGQPGPPITVRPFAPGTVTPGAVIAKLGTSIFAAARSRANAKAAADAQAATNQYHLAQAEDLKNRVGNRQDVTIGGTTVKGVSPDAAAGALSRMHSGATGVDHKVTLTSPVFGHKVGDVVDSRQLTAEGDQAGINARAANVNNGQLGSKVAAARGAIDSIKYQFSKEGPLSQQVYGEGSRAASHFASILRVGDQNHPEWRQALARLGLPPAYRFDPTNATSVGVLNEAANRFTSDYYTAKMANERAKLQPQYDAAQQTISQYGGVDEGAAPAETPATAPAGGMPSWMPKLPGDE